MTGGNEHGGITYVKVTPSPQAEVGDGVRASAVLGKLFLRGPPVYIPLVFETGSQPLERILRKWWRRYR